MKKTKHTRLALYSLLAASCQLQPACEPVSADADLITMECRIQNGTRGSYTMEVGDFRLYRYSFEGPNLNCDIYGEYCRRYGLYWVTANPYRKTVAGFNRYLGIGPDDHVGPMAEASVNETLTRGGHFSADIRVPEDAAAQADLIFGFSEACDAPAGEYRPSIGFRHILANVRVSAYTSEPVPGVTITEVGFIDVYDGCTFSFDNDTERMDCTGQYQSRPSCGKSVRVDMIGCNLPADESTEFFLVPQTVPDGGLLYLDYKGPDDASGRVYLDISGDSWPAGVKTTYSLHLVSIEGDDGTAGLIIGDFRNHHDYDETF